jgi:energy-coupling factor transporter ATP-binding protein EcfA2
MITKIELKNFKSHAHTVIEPGRVTAIVGPNGCGKSSLLQAIDLMRQLGNDSLDRIYREQRQPSSFARGLTDEVKISLHGINNKIEWEARIQWKLLSVADSSWPANWAASFYGKQGTDEAKIDELRQQDLLVNNAPRSLLKILASNAYFKGISENLALPSYSDRVEPNLSSNGQGLASLFAYLLGNSRKVAEQIENSLKSIVPIIKQVGFRPAKITKNETRLITFDKTITPISDARELIGQELVFDTTSADSVLLK